MADPTDDLIDHPLEVVTEGRAVVLLGPDGVSLAITAEAAERSAQLLLEAAQRAKAASGGE